MNTKIITSLGTAVIRIFDGSITEDQVFVIANTQISDKEDLENIIRCYSEYRWDFLTAEQEKNLDACIDKCDWDGYAEKFDAYKSKNREKCAKICRSLMANGRVFQYRLLKKLEDEHPDPDLWEVDKKSGLPRLRVASFDRTDFDSLSDYVRWQKSNGYGRWLSYLFPNGLQSIEQFKPFVTYID